MNEEEEDKFLKEDPVVFKKYQVKRRLGEGAFGEVYLGQAIEDKSYVALKVEPRKIAKPVLQSEAFLLYSIAGLGIPAVRSFGKVKNYNVLVEPLLGKSLFDIFAENHKEMPIEDVCLIGKQVIDRIQWVHSKYIVHRDIKPDNFLIGKEDPNVIYLIDFGLSKKYRSSNSGKHIRFGFTGKLTGTVRFASANALRGGEQSRRDDIESIGYMMVYFMKKRLPWQGVTGTRKMERYLKIYKLKKNTTPEALCEGLPEEMTEYIRYAKKLEFEQEPNYNYLRKLFNKMLKRVHNTNELLVFSWIKLNDLPKLKNPVNPQSRKESPQSRIYRRIKKSLERERNLSSDSNDSKHSYQQVYSQAKVRNLKVLDKDNFPESEFEEKKEKKINKKFLKMKEELNTMIANLDTFVDEGAVDFENEKLIGSKDIGEITNNKNLFSNMNNGNKIMGNKFNFERESNNDLYDKNNAKFPSNKDNLINQNKNIINNYLDNLADINENIEKKPEINNIINKKDINDISKKIENKDDVEKKKENNNINININNFILQKNVDNLNSLEKKIEPIKNEQKQINLPFDSINNMLFTNNDITNYENRNNNEINQKDQKNENDENKISLKISNFEGRDFTFNESLNFKQNIKFNKEIKESIPENMENELIEDKQDNNFSNPQGNNEKVNNNLIDENYLNNKLDSQNILENKNMNLMHNNIINNKNNNLNIDKNKNNINNAINKNKLNKITQIKKKNPPIKKRDILNLNNKNQNLNQKINNNINANKINYPSDNNENAFDFLSNEKMIQRKENQIKKIGINNFNNNANIIRKTNKNNNINLYQNAIDKNELIHKNNLTFENMINLIPNDGINDDLNKKAFEFEDMNKKNMIQNINKQRKGNLKIMPNNKNNIGNNITNININIKNNYVQNNDKNKNIKIVNLNKKKRPIITKNITTDNLQTNLLNNNNLPNKIRISPRNQANQRQFLNANIGNLYNNNQILLNNPSNIPKNNLNIMVNNQNNRNIQKINPAFNIKNNILPNQMQINPNIIPQYANNLKNVYPNQYVYTGGNTPNIQNKVNFINPVNPNINYGVMMQPRIPTTNYTNIFQNNEIRYNNTANNFNNIQNFGINSDRNYKIYNY